MTPTLIALKLTLDALELPIYPHFFPLCSHSLYLSQRWIHDLGYHFHYCDGLPESDHLQRDFVTLTDALESGDRDHYRQHLHSALFKKLSTFATTLEPEPDWALSRSDWIGLLAHTAFVDTIQPGLAKTLPVSLQHLSSVTHHTYAESFLKRLPILLSR